MSPSNHPPETGTTAEVGYCKPPKASQWKKSQSGNPAGKKKGAQNLKTVFNKLAAKKVSVTAPNGKKLKKPLLELLIMAIFQRAQNGKKAMVPIMAQLLEHQFYEPAPGEKPPVLGKIIKGPDGVYQVDFWSNELMASIDALVEAAKVPISDWAEDDETYTRDNEAGDP